MTDNKWEITMRFENCGYYLLDKGKEVKWLRTKTERNNEMTDKQIIIDGVDVSGCENLMQGIVPFGCMEDRKTCSCMNNPNCLYKQLQRKEQEYEAYKMEAEEGKEINAELKAENEELKNLNTRLDNQRETYWKGYKKLKQTLTEIKKILLFNKKELDECLHNDIDGQILQKLSEVEE